MIHLSVSIAGISGRLGTTLARRFATGGASVTGFGAHERILVQAAVQDLELTALGVEVQEASESLEFADIVVLAVPWDERDMALDPEAVRNKIVIDAMNADDGSKGSSEAVAAMLPGAKIVKAFNTIPWLLLQEPERFVVPIATNDRVAAVAVQELARAAQLHPLYIGPLEHGRLFEPDAPLHGEDMSRRMAAVLRAADTSPVTE